MNYFKTKIKDSRYFTTLCQETADIIFVWDFLHIMDSNLNNQFLVQNPINSQSEQEIANNNNMIQFKEEQQKNYQQEKEIKIK